MVTMAFSPSRFKAFQHARSVSLPSELHPAITLLDENLKRVMVSSSMSSMKHRLNRLQNSYDSIDDLLLRLLDACSNSRDVLFLTKQHMYEVLSSVRRRRDAVNFCGYLNTRMKSRKIIQKSLKDLRSIQKEDCENVWILNQFKDAESVLSVFESVLCCISGSKVQHKQNGWSLVPRLVHNRNVSCQSAEMDINEFPLCSIICQKTSKDMRVQEFMIT